MWVSFPSAPPYWCDVDGGRCSAGGHFSMCSVFFPCVLCVLSLWWSSICSFNPLLSLFLPVVVVYRDEVGCFVQIWCDVTFPPYHLLHVVFCWHRWFYLFRSAIQRIWDGCSKSWSCSPLCGKWCFHFVEFGG